VSINPYLAWKYKLEVHVTGFSTTKDFLANITLLYRPGMRADFRDIRASTKTGAKIPLFIESVTEFNQAFIWFKLPQNTDFFYLHYGNGGATSESDGKKVFTFFDHFEKLDSTVWRTIAGSATVSGSILTLQNTSQSSVLESYSTFPPNTVVEIRAQYNAGNRTIFGYRSYSSQKAAAWQSSAVGDANNQRFAHNGSTGNWDSDGVNRAGGSYYVYGVAHIVTGPLYYVNYTYRGTITDYIPGNVSLPVQFYCYSNTGPFRVDWVRVRDFDATLPTLTIGRKFTTQPKGFPWDNAITEANTRMGMYPSVNIKSFLKNINTKLGMKASVMFRRPLFYSPQLRSPYPRWKYQGEIYLGEQESPARVRLPILPGMALDGRDLRYTDLDDKELKFNIFDTGLDFLDCWVEIPAGTTRIKFYYGNGIAKTKSDPSIVGVPQTETIVTVTPHIGGGGDVWQTSIEIIPEIQLSHRPQWKTPQIYYEYIKTPSSFMGMAPGEPTFKERRELGDYAIVSCEVNRSINDAYMQLSTEFQNLTVPPEGSTIKHNAYDSHGNPHLLFHGKIVTNSPTHGHYSQTVKMHAVDNSINLVTQPVPWNYHIIDTEVDSIQTWINRLLEPEKTGVYPNTIINVNVEPRQFIFDPKAKRLEAIRKLAEYARCMYQTKLITREIDGHIITRPEFYFVPPERIDEPVNGFDLPAPLILDADTSKLISDPHVMNESEEKYNSVLVYGVLSENGETVVAQAFSYEVYTGEQKPKVYIIEDNAITEKGSTAEREAIKWLLYFLSKRVKVTMSFVDRFDLELYQRIRFGPGFSNKLQELTSSTQVQQVAACDPRDAENSTHLIDVSGVPRPRWLRISDLKHTSEHKLEMVSVTAITDNIYSVVDPIVPAPWSDYLSPSYYKPIIDDLVDTTQSIVEDNIAKQLTPESCTVLSINEENKTAVVQTASGKIVTVSLA
jgi:hypothetical protein